MTLECALSLILGPLHNRIGNFLVVLLVLLTLSQHSFKIQPARLGSVQVLPLETLLWIRLLSQD